MKSQQGPQRRKRRFSVRRKRTLDPGITIDYKKPDILRRFITDRGKIIPRRISGATAKQQRVICRAVKRARFLALIPYSIAHRPERGFTGDMSASVMAPPAREFGPRRDFGGGRDGGGRDGGGGFRRDFRDNNRDDADAGRGPAAGKGEEE